jgi:TPR repeat protein
LKQAAAQGHTESQFLLAQKLESDQQNEEAFEWYRQAAEGGHAKAQFLVGQAYANNALPASLQSASSSSSASSRYETASKWLSLASEQGNVPAQCRLGFLCFHGVGMEANKPMGVMWLTNAAEAVSRTTHATRLRELCHDDRSSLSLSLLHSPSDTYASLFSLLAILLLVSESHGRSTDVGHDRLRRAPPTASSQCHH